MKLLKKNGKRIFLVLCVLVGLILLISATVMLNQYNGEILLQSSTKAQYYSLQARDQVQDELDKKTKTAIAAANALSNVDEANLGGEISNLLAREEFKDIMYLKYFKGENLYTQYGDLNTETNDPSIKYHTNVDTMNIAGYVGEFLDTASIQSHVCFYAPVEGKAITGVSIYYGRRTFNDIFDTVKVNELAKFSVLCTDEGILVGSQEQKGTQLLPSNNLFDSLKTDGASEEVVSSLRKIMQSSTEQGKVYNDAVEVKIGVEDYVISVSTDPTHMQELRVVELYKVQDLFASTFDFIGSIIFIIVIFIAVTVAFITYLIIRDIKMNKQIYSLETIDLALNCFNRNGFEKEAKKVIQRNPLAQFCIVVIELQHYKFLQEQFGEQEVSSLVKYFNYSLNNLLETEEIYGHVHDGTFLFLMHEDEKKVIEDKLKNFSFILSKYKGANTFDIAIKYGIYQIDHSENLAVTKMIDFANEAISTSTGDVRLTSSQFYFYNDDLRRIRIQNEDMELRMESALQNKEFQVFYQPKYNLTTNLQEGAEALVRWYDKDKDKYNRPDLFINLFESNGFIVKLDKYVFTQVCEFLSYCTAHGNKVLPISVNVSRVTAVQPEFVDYYIKTKRRFGLADGLIIIEFTESFAYENYEILGDIVKKLHDAGFLCSIDDFGLGYSSYRTLKELPMDEIKLDKLFLEQGYTSDRDDSIFESIISLAKSLNMKVTQEGVETYEEVTRMRSHGCNLIQGYFYSHPLQRADYIQFLANTLDHTIK